MTAEWRGGVANIDVSGKIPKVISIIDVDRRKIAEDIEIQSLGDSESLLSNAENLLAILWKLSADGQPPEHETRLEICEEIRVGLLHFFENYRPFLVSEEGKIKLFVEDEGKRIVLPARNLPSGFLKVLTILTALKLEPDILFIDEFENSLHMAFQETLFELFISKASTQAVISTHSPISIEAALDTIKDGVKVLGFDLNVAGYTVVKDFDEEREIISFLEEKKIASRSHLYLIW